MQDAGLACEVIGESPGPLRILWRFDQFGAAGLADYDHGIRLWWEGDPLSLRPATAGVRIRGHRVPSQDVGCWPKPSGSLKR